MKASEILTLKNYNEQLTLLKKNQSDFNTGNIDDSISFYEGKHAILQDEVLQDEWITEEVMNSEGKIEKKSFCVKKTKLALPYPQQIVSNCTSFLYGNDIDLVLNSGREEDNKQKAFNQFVHIWNNDLRMMGLLKSATIHACIETRSAIQFFESDGKVKAKVLCRKKGYDIYRHKDENEKLDAVIVEYKRDKIDKGRLRSNVSTTDIWMADGLLRYEGSRFISEESKKAPIKKILIAYLEQDYPEYHCVRPIIETQDYCRSNHSQVNKNIGNPALVVHGTLTKKPLYSATTRIYEVQAPDGFDPSKNTSGRMEYLELTTAPESVKLEMQNNETDIYRFTWPDLNRLMTEAKNGNMSTQSMKLTFLQSFVKLAEKRITHDEFVSRCINIIKELAAVVYDNNNIKDLDISFKYNSILPDSVSDMINMLAVAVGAGITSRENAVRILTINGPETLEEIYKERLEEAITANAKAASANVNLDGVENNRNEEGIN